MALTNPNTPVSQQDLQDFYHKIRPYMGSFPEAIANKFNKGNMFSTDEKLIGQWIDGKPLYQRTIVDTMPTIASSGTRESKVITLASDIDFICNMYGVLHRSNGTIVPIGEYYNQESGNIPSFAMMTSGLVDNNRTLFVASSTVSDSERPIYVTIQYTKTADSAVSMGDDTDYSTTEKIVGTWIDGRPVYQKTVDVTVPSTTDDTFVKGQYDVTSLNIDFPIKVTGVGRLVASQSCVVFDSVFETNTGKVIKGLIDTNNTKLTVWTNASAYGNATYAVTIQYIKTTS